LVNIGCAVSNDDGNNWRTNGACVVDTVVDRQWLAMDNGITAAASDNTVFHAYRQAARGSFIYSSPGSTGVADPIGGIVYQNSSANLVNPVSQGAPCGQMRFDPFNRNLYYPCAEGDHVNITVGQVAVGQRTGITYTNVDTPASPGGGPVGDIFPAVATDAVGNVYAVWIDETDHNVYYSSSTNEGTTWSTPQQINGNDANSNEFVWAQAGSAGKLAVVWLGSSSHLDSDFMPSWYNNRQAAPAFKWFGYASLISNAAGSPTYAQVKFTDQPSHYGQICNQGLFCTVSGGDRTMADFLSLYLDRDGAMRIVFNDTTSQHHGAHIFEVRQVAGPSAFGGTISKAVPTNPVSDPTGDAQAPHYSPAGAGPNQPALDFTQIKLSQPSTNTLRVQMTVSGSLSAATPPVGESNSLWLTRFQALSRGDEGEESYRIFYVGAEAVGPGPPTTFFAGSGDSNNNGVPGDGCVNTTPENCKIVQYPIEESATGSASGNVITIDVQLSNGFGTGRPILGDTIYNVTALSAGRSEIPATPVNDDFLYRDVDATKSFDFKLGGGGGGGGGGGACKITGGGAIPSTMTGEARFSLNPQGNLNGKVQFNDDGAGVNFRSTKLNVVTCNGRNGHVEGEGTNNGAATSFTVDVVDNGEPGTADTFRIHMTGYDNDGTLTRGNIQVHG
jgi:hypothetical protein